MIRGKIGGEKMGNIMKSSKCSYWLGTSFAAAALLLATPTWADNDTAGATTPAQSGQTNTSSDQRVRQVSGRITAIDTSTQTITVKATLLSKVIKVGSDAQIATEGSSSAALNDLKVGDRVEVSYRVDGDTLAAQRITRKSSQSSESSGRSSPSTY
jgi:hypothetical protein